MRDIRTFVKLFDLNVPEYEHIDYYINQYSRLKRWNDIKNNINLYHDFACNVSDPYAYKIQKSEEIINFLKSTRSFNELIDDNLIPELPVTKNFEYSEEKKYISIDINNANWQVLKRYDPDFLNELGDSWIEFLKRFKLHPVFYKSKQFRQHIFGHINPKKQVKAQRVIIENFINSIDKNGIKAVCIKHDEVIFSFDEWSQIINIVQEVDKISYLKWKLFKIKRVEDFRLISFHDINGSFLHKELSGCNGNKYFIYLKKYIFNEPIDIRDLYFRNDGDLAIWNVEGLKLEL